jgi:hypothetical protein
MVSSNDAIAEASLNLKGFFKKAYKKKTEMVQGLALLCCGSSHCQVFFTRAHTTATTPTLAPSAPGAQEAVG